jgi:hypothetical protein
MESHDAEDIPPRRSQMMSALARTDAARRRWSVASRAGAAVVGGYALTSLVTLALSLLLPAMGMARPEALLAATVASFPVYAAVIMAVFHARSAARAWMLLAAGAAPLAAAVAMAWPGAGA